jgi:steroid 5-alpha reductase family enzyme
MCEAIARRIGRYNVVDVAWWQGFFSCASAAIGAK